MTAESHPTDSPRADELLKTAAANELAEAAEMRTQILGEFAARALGVDPQIGFIAENGAVLTDLEKADFLERRRNG